MTDFRIALMTLNSVDAAKQLAKELVEAHLAACVNIVPRLTSIYQWEGKLEEDEESLLICKTHVSHWPKFVTFVEKRHPYAVPEIIQLPILAGSDNYMAWMATCLGIK